MSRLQYTAAFPNVSLPRHAVVGDVGIDLTAIKLHKQLTPKTAMYDTGICIQPSEGYYTEVVARSSIVKTGYMLSNSVAIIDPNYRGSIKIVLTKVDESMPDLTVPFTLCQLLLRRAETINPVRVERLDDSVRGDGGFGSTNKN